MLFRSESVGEGLRQGQKQISVFDADSEEVSHYSQLLMDPATGLSYKEPAPHNFSFNSPLGACPGCKGLGYVNIVDRDKIVPDSSLSIRQGAILPLGKYKNSMVFWQIEAICANHGYTLDTPFGELSEECVGDILNGTNERLSLKNETMATSNYFLTYEGLVKYIEMQQSEDSGAAARKWSGQWFSRKECPECGGRRLNREALHFFIDGKNIADQPPLNP